MDTLASVTPHFQSDESAVMLPPQLRMLALLAAAQGLVMIAYAAADLALAVVNGSDAWGAVWFVVVGLGLWGLGLIAVSRGLRHRRRWAFTPVIFTQLMFGLLAISFFGDASTPAKVVWALVLALAVVTIWLAFSREVRDAVITPTPQA